MNPTLEQLKVWIGAVPYDWIPELTKVVIEAGLTRNVFDPAAGGAAKYTEWVEKMFNARLKAR